MEIDKLKKEHIAAVGNRCSISDGSKCVHCAAISKSVAYINALESQLSAQTAVRELLKDMLVFDELPTATEWEIMRRGMMNLVTEVDNGN